MRFLESSTREIENEILGQAFKKISKNNFSFKGIASNNLCKEVLKALGVNFKEAYELSGQEYDFAVFNEENELILLIELGVKDQYLLLEGVNNLDNFIDSLLTNYVKKEYCKQNNYDLLVLDYNDYENIEDIIDRKLLEVSIKSILKSGGGTKR